MSGEQNGGRNINRNVDNKSSESVANLELLERQKQIKFAFRIILRSDKIGGSFGTVQFGSESFVSPSVV
jgi:hypothetical protein